MAYERIILDIETTNLLEPMIDFTQRPLALKPDAKLWCIAVKCIDTNNSFVMIPPEILEEIESIIGKERLEELTSINPKLALLNKRIDIRTPIEFKLNFKEKLMMNFNLNFLK